MSHSKASPEWKFQSPAAHAKEDNKAECEHYEEYEEEDDEGNMRRAVELSLRLILLYYFFENNKKRHAQKQQRIAMFSTSTAAEVEKDATADKGKKEDNKNKKCSIKKRGF